MKAPVSDKTVAIVTVAGSQHLIYTGQKITVNRITQAADQTLTVPSLLDQTPVTLKVLSHTLGKKVNGLKFKNKVRYIKHYGHRQHQTVLEVVSIGAVAAATKVAEKIVATSKEKPEVTAPSKTTSKKPTTKKTVTKRSVKKAEVANG